MKKFITILLAGIVFAGFAGCGAVAQPEASDETMVLSEPTASPAATEKPSATIEATAEPTPSPTPEPITYPWDGIELVLENITDDVEISADMAAPSGKYVVVTFSVSGGDLIVDHYIGVFKERFTLTCGGETYYAVSYVVENLNMNAEDHLLHSTGPLHIYFDLPAEADISDAVFAIVEAS